MPDRSESHMDINGIRDSDRQNSNVRDDPCLVPCLHYNFANINV